MRRDTNGKFKVGDGELGHAPGRTISITAKNIKESCRRHSGHCMIADAIKEAYPAATRISVDLQTIRFSNHNKRERYVFLTPRPAQIALVRFDQGADDIKPFRFKIGNGQTVAYGSRTPAAEQRLYNASTRKKKTAAKLRASNRGGSSPPVIAGGRTPPMAPGARRSFGMKALAF